MTTRLQNHTADILEFPRKKPAALGSARIGSNKTDTVKPASTVTLGPAWYHGEAIEEAIQNPKH